MASHKKRERTQNWTPEEKILLLKLCGHNINILESKKADQYSLTIKTNVWKDIHKEFISKLGTDRDILRLKEQWQRMKKQARSELQDYKTRSRNQNDIRKISNISEEVLKIMQIAHRNNQEEDDISFSSSENSEQDNTPTYFCETEVKQELNDEEDSEGSLSSLTAVINSQSQLNLSNKHENIFNVLTSENAATKTKRKSNEIEEMQFLFESKHKEHQKRMQIIDEQLKTAKIQREIAELQKQAVQQELKQLLMSKDKKIVLKCDENDEIINKIHFHQHQIKHHEDEIEKHKQKIEDIINREH